VHRRVTHGRPYVGHFCCISFPTRAAKSSAFSDIRCSAIISRARLPSSLASASFKLSTPATPRSRSRAERRSSLAARRSFSAASLAARRSFSAASLAARRSCAAISASRTCA
jgi:hypothetical protein